MNCPKCRRKARFWFHSNELEGWSLFECRNCGTEFYVELEELEQ